MDKADVFSVPAVTVCETIPEDINSLTVLSVARKQNMGQHDICPTGSLIALVAVPLLNTGRNNNATKTKWKQISGTLCFICPIVTKNKNRWSLNRRKDAECIELYINHLPLWMSCYWFIPGRLEEFAGHNVQRILRHTYSIYDLWPLCFVCLLCLLSPVCISQYRTCLHFFHDILWSIFQPLCILHMGEYGPF